MGLAALEWSSNCCRCYWYAADAVIKWRGRGLVAMLSVDFADKLLLFGGVSHNFWPSIFIYISSHSNCLAFNVAFLVFLKMEIEVYSVADNKCIGFIYAFNEWNCLLIRHVPCYLANISERLKFTSLTTAWSNARRKVAARLDYCGTETRDDIECRYMKPYNCVIWSSRIRNSIANLSTTNLWVAICLSPSSLKVSSETAFRMQNIRN